MTIRRLITLVEAAVATYPYIIMRVNTRTVFDGSRFVYGEDKAMQFPDHDSAEQMRAELEKRHRHKMHLIHLVPTGTPTYVLQHKPRPDSEWSTLSRGTDVEMLKGIVDRGLDQHLSLRIVTDDDKVFYPLEEHASCQS